jgi:LPS sulfotransferase NodH
LSVKSTRQPRPERSPLPDLRYERHLAKVIEELESSLDTTFQLSPFRSLNRRFVIACSPRTGSHLLGQSLNEYGGVVREFFHAKQINRVCSKQGFLTLEEYCAFIVNKWAKGGVFGVKGAIQILAPLTLASEIPDYISDWRFVFLQRTDVVKQAISLFLASLTGSYKASKQPAREVVDEDFNGRKIATMAGNALAVNATWEEFFSQFAIEPLRVTYEELAADPPQVAARTAEFLDLRGPPIADKRLLRPAVKVQATTLNERWARRFHEEGWRFGEDALR